MIPKILHQTWYTNDLTPLLAERVASTKAQNPDWDYGLWSDANIEAWLESNGHTKDLERFRAIRIGPAKADLWRLIILYYMGGIYMDLDNLFTVPIDEWLEPDAPCLIMLNKLRRVDFCTAGCEPKNSYVENTLRTVRERIDKRDDGSALSVTGPCNWRSSNQENKTRIQLIAGTECEESEAFMSLNNDPRKHCGQLGTPPRDQWVGKIKFISTRNRKPWSEVKRPEVNWQKSRNESLYH